MNSLPFSALVGTRVVSIAAVEGKEEAFIVTESLSARIFHYQDCCESVDICKVIGDGAALVGHVITLAEEDSREPDSFTHEFGQWSESHTWTSYYIEAGGHRLEIWFLGESNGYYSETTGVEVTEVKHE